jgi:hypothetical protein
MNLQNKGKTGPSLVLLSPLLSHLAFLATLGEQGDHFPPKFYHRNALRVARGEIFGPS